MQFSVFAVATQPDIVNARRLHDLDGLDDASVVKVMQHQARQRGFPPGILAPEQERIVALTVIEAQPGYVRLDTLNLYEKTERQILEVLCDAIAMENPLLHWDPGARSLRVLDHRMLLHGIVCPAYWSAREAQSSTFIDVGSWLRDCTATGQDLDELARMIGLPGLMGFSEDVMPMIDEIAPARLELSAYTEVPALNLLLIGARRLLVAGQLTPGDVERLHEDLKDRLAASSQKHCVGFLEHWDNR